MKLTFFLNSILLGIGLAMDAFSVSLANGLNEPKMKKSKVALIAITFGVFQALMPLIGWFCVHAVKEAFSSFEKLIPWIAFILLVYIGGKMIVDGFKNNEEAEVSAFGVAALMLQAVATSIDALSVGFTIAEYNFPMAVTGAFIIGLETYIICFAGIAIGKKAGTKLSGKATLLGGIILIVIGLKIFIEGVLI